LPDLPPLARIRLFKQEILKAEPINSFHYSIRDPRPIPDIKEEWLPEKLHPLQESRVVHPRRCKEL
jgi:hypothetical protein